MIVIESTPDQSDTIYIYTLKFSPLFFISWVHSPTAKLKPLVSNPHTSTSLITGDQHVAIHVEASISSMHLIIGRATAVCTRQLGQSEIREIITAPRIFSGFWRLKKLVMTTLYNYCGVYSLIFVYIKHTV